jgi:hypothetical protein
LPGLPGLILDKFALIGEIAVLRSAMGSRYLTPLGVVAAYLLLMGLPLVLTAILTYSFASSSYGLIGGLFAAFMASRLGWTNGTALFTWFTWFFLGRAIWLWIDADYRRRGGPPIPSTYSGRPSPLWRWLPLGLDEGQIKRYGEPLLLLGVAYGLHTTDLLLALYLGTSGLAIALKEFLEQRILAHQAADLDDQVFGSAALAGRFGGSVASTPPQGTAQPAPVDPWADSPTMMSAWAGLPSEYGTLLNAPLPEPEPVVEDWSEPSAAEPLVEDWFESTGSPGTISAPHQEVAAVAPRRVKVTCPSCQQVGRISLRSGRHKLRCNGCNHKFGVTVRPRQPAS